MKCPSCANTEDKVIDSRQSKDGDFIRRRRECLKCKIRFTSFEKIESNIPNIIKKDRRREPYDRQKMLRSLEKACEKRPISVDKRYAVVAEIEKNLLELMEKEVPSSFVGEQVLESLRYLDQVAYVRFASVYRQFENIKEFREEISKIEKKMPYVIKKDNKREHFNRQKILRGLEKACEKRPVTFKKQESMLRRIEKAISKKEEVESSLIGEEIMKNLKEIDEVAYVRFASVYRQFKDIKEFKKEIEEIFSDKKRTKS